MILRMAKIRFCVAAFAMMVPINVVAAAPQRIATRGPAALDRSNITFKSAITIEAIQRSNDAVVRKLIGQIGDLKRQITAGQGNANQLRIELGRTQEEIGRRLSETDAKYAAERAAFLQAISTLFESSDVKVLELLHRYAEGDAAALESLQELFRRSNGPRPKRLVDQRAIATLVVEEVRRNEKDIREQIAASEAKLRADPNDYGELLQIRGLYLQTAQFDRARDASDRITRIEGKPSFDDAPHMRAFTLGQDAIISTKAGRLDEALRFAEEAVALTRITVAEGFGIWQARHPGATEPRETVEDFNREQLAVALRYLFEVRKARGEFDQAILAGEEAVAVRRLNLENELRKRGKIVTAYGSYAAGDAIEVGNLFLASGDPQGALSVFRTVLSLVKLGPFSNGKTYNDAFWAFIPFARAAIAAGQLDEAKESLAIAYQGLKRAQPSVHVIGNEGRYWLQMGNLLSAEAKANEAREAWSSAETALTQAISLDRDNEDWRDSLAEVESRLTNGQ